MTEPAAQAQQIAPYEPWREVTQPESRGWAFSATIAIVFGQWYVSTALRLQPDWLFPAVVAALLGISIGIYLPRRDDPPPAVRAVALVTSSVIVFANAVSLVALIYQVFTGHLLWYSVGLASVDAHLAPVELLLAGTVLWIVNVLNFALIYWELDGNGPTERAQGLARYPDFLFPVQQAPGWGPESWKPGFLDYVFLALTTAVAVGPSDTYPMTGRAKLAMGAECVLSVSILAVLIARAVSVATG